MKNLLQSVLLLTLCVFVTHLTFSQSTTFSYIGQPQTYTVPPGVINIQVEAWGAQGSNATFGTVAGGLGGYSIGTLNVTPGEILNIYVGGQIGYNGGGTGGLQGNATLINGPSAGVGPSGGGASDVRQGGNSLNDRVIVGGGGGGAGNDGSWINCQPSLGSPGGDGGALVGITGVTATSSLACNCNGSGGIGGSGGTQTVGGAAGGYSGTSCLNNQWNIGQGGSFGLGGNGDQSNPYAGDGAGGGGGGGYYGGGAGGDGVNTTSAGGGGGGASYIGGVTAGSTSSGLQTGNGSVIVTILCDPLTTTVSATTVCFGEMVVLHAESTNGGTIMWDNGITDNVGFSPSVGVTTYTATSNDVNDCAFAVLISVNDSPTVDAGLDIILCNDGTDTVLNAVGTGDTYVWDNGIADGISFSPSVGATMYHVTAEDTATGCQTIDSVLVTVNDLPTVDAGADINECTANMLTLTGAGTADSYVWDNGISDGVAFSPALGVATYIVIGTNTTTGCMNTDTVDVTTNESPTITLIASDEILGADGSIDLTINSGIAPFTFDWDNDGTGDNDDTQNLTGLVSGNYSVIMTDSNGCTVLDSITVDSQLSVNTNLLLGLNVYPNPTAGLVNVEMEGNFEYLVLNLMGQTIYRGTANGSKIVSLSSFESGVYLLQISVGNIMETIRLVKH
jgi:hypothetical protein